MLTLKHKNWTVVKKVRSVIQMSPEFKATLSLFVVLTENTCCGLCWKTMLLGCNRPFFFGFGDEIEKSCFWYYLLYYWSLTCIGESNFPQQAKQFLCIEVISDLSSIYV